MEKYIIAAGHRLKKDSRVGISKKLSHNFLYLNKIFFPLFLLYGFYFTNIHDPQESRRRGKSFNSFKSFYYFLTTKLHALKKQGFTSFIIVQKQSICGKNQRIIEQMQHLQLFPLNYRVPFYAS